MDNRDRESEDDVEGDDKSTEGGGRANAGAHEEDDGVEEDDDKEEHTADIEGSCGCCERTAGEEICRWEASGERMPAGELNVDGCEASGTLDRDDGISVVHKALFVCDKLVHTDEKPELSE